jgi:hypothetical protein
MPDVVPTVTPDPDQDARTMFSNLMVQTYGFSADQVDSMMTQLLDWNSKGYTQESIVNTWLPTTDAYKQRFAGNKARISAGLVPLTPAQYLDTEMSFKQVASKYNLPQGFFSQDTIQKFIETNKSPDEIQSRIQMAGDVINNADPYYKESLSSMYGLTQGDMIAHLLDPESAQPLLERQMKAIEYGSAAMAQGLQVSQPSTYEQYASGVGTRIGAEAGMAQVAELTPGLTNLAAIGGEQYDQATAEAEVFGGLASAKRKREQLINEEQNRFTGRSNVDSKSLQGGISGQF